MKDTHKVSHNKDGTVYPGCSVRQPVGLGIASDLSTKMVPWL